MISSYILALCERLDNKPTTLTAVPYIAEHLQTLRDENFPLAVIAGLEEEVASLTRKDYDYLECKITATRVVEAPKHISKMVSLFQSITI